MSMNSVSKAMCIGIPIKIKLVEAYSILPHQQNWIISNLPILTFVESDLCH